MLFPPTTAVGQLQSEIERLKTQLNNKGNQYEINTLNNKIRSLESTIGELRTEINSMVSRLQALER